MPHDSQQDTLGEIIKMYYAHVRHNFTFSFPITQESLQIPLMTLLMYWVRVVPSKYDSVMLYGDEVRSYIVFCYLRM
jgi:hypothetical protein